MIDQWLKKDLQNICATHPVAVLIDESGDAEFLLKTVENDFTVYTCNSELEELHVKFIIEKSYPTEKRILIYTRFPKDDLKFIREYCETCGCLEIRYLQHYIKEKVHQTLNLNINLPKDELIAAAKVSVGKDRTYWMDLSHKGATEIFDLHKELLPFVHDPKTYSVEKYDAQLRETFYKKVNELLGQEYLTKPAPTLANEVVQTMFDGLLSGSCDKILDSVYRSWLDSVSYRDSFLDYLANYSVDSSVAIWGVTIHHPFRQIDEIWLAEIGKNITDTKSIGTTLATLRKRHKTRQAHALGINFWGDVLVLLEFDPKDIVYLSSLKECADFYRNHFCKLDTAIRHLYAEFLNKKNLLEPFQELYKEYVSIFLDSWFKHWNEYQETQTGTLQKIIDESRGEKTAVIVGDGVAYEIAELVAEKVKGTATVTKDAIFADVPSETENNMSRIYMANGVTEAVQRNREKYLVTENPDIDIDFIRLDEVTEDARPGQFLVCTYKDIDDMGEKLQQKALKYFPETIDFFAEKISVLLASGYTKVYLITDHGFVLTGILSNAEKISVLLVGDAHKAERYIRAEQRQGELGAKFVEVARKYKQFQHLYFAKNIHPFKTPGLYGFSHGGLSPQELITPFFCWTRSSLATTTLQVTIDNKNELQDVTGENFSIKLQADKGTGDLFSIERKVYLVFFAEKAQVNKSDILSIKPDEYVVKEYTFDGQSELEIQLLDATSKQQLDRVIVKQNKDRDLGGLFDL